MYTVYIFYACFYLQIKRLIISRAFIFIFGIGIINFLSISSFDSSSLMLNNKILDKFSNSWLDKICLKYLNCFSNWDGQHFLHIAQYGYEHEKMYAFYPGLPLIINSIILFLKKYIFLFWFKLHFKSMALICGILWNGFISTYFSSIILYYLTIKIYNKPSMALITSKLFLINPASIFFCSIYTESTFAFVSFLLMLCCELKYFDMNQFKNNKHSSKLNNLHSVILMISIILCIIIASSLRSNGIIIIGFPLYYHIYSNWFIKNNIINALSFIRNKIINKIFYYVLVKGGKKKNKKQAPQQQQQQDIDININCSNIFIHLLKLIGLIGLLSIGLTPWFYYQYWSKQQLCHNKTNILLFNRLYCTSFWNSVYSYVQHNYWQCGLFMRYNKNEIGNFLLASPIWYISFHAIKHYIDQFYIISTIKLHTKNIIQYATTKSNYFLASSLWSTLMIALKKLIKISNIYGANIANHNENKNNDNNNNNHNNNNIKNGLNTDHIQVAMEKIINGKNGYSHNHHHQNGKHKRLKNGNHHNHHNNHNHNNNLIASGVKLLTSMGMLDNLSNNNNNNHNHKDLEIKHYLNNETEILLNHKLIPYIIYWCLLWGICIFYAHVQITTRFICCSCPALYWFCAEIIYLTNYNESDPTKIRKKHNKKKWCDHIWEGITQKPKPKLIIAYFLLYFTVGTIAFCAFLPFV